MSRRTIFRTMISQNKIVVFLASLLLALLPPPSASFPSISSPSSSSSSSSQPAFPVDNSRPPSIKRQPRRNDVIFDAREDLRLTCDAVGVPAVVYEWRRNGALIDIDAHPNISMALGRGDLIIKSPSARDQGFYQCLATNRVGVSLSNVFNVRPAFLDQMPKVINPETRPGKVGGHVTLTCSTPHSLPDAEIFWTHEGEDASFDAMQMTETLAMDPKGNLHFLTLSPEDANDGWPYTCNIYNKVMRSIQQGDDQIVELVDIDDVKEVASAEKSAPILLYAPDAETFALRGVTLKLKCIFAGNPTPTTKWRRDGKFIDSSSSSFSPDSHLFIENNDRILAIRNVQPDDAGKYECVGDNGVGSEVVAATSVTVEAAPFFVSKPENVEYAEEETSSISCDAGGIPAPEVKMFRNGRPIEDVFLDKRYEIDVDGKKITISGLLKGVDDAVFQCNASNIHGYVFADATFRVLAIPPFFETAPPGEAASIQGRQETVIPCDAFGVPAPKVSWFFTTEDEMGNKTTEEIEIDGVKFISGESGLTIVDATPEHAGVYTCHAENKYGAVEAVSALRVYEKTLVNLEPSTEVLSVNLEEMRQQETPEDGVQLKCLVSHDSRLSVKIDWEIDEKPLSEEDDGPFEVKTESFEDSSISTLLISPVSRGLEGAYACVGHTDFDSASSAARLEVFDVPAAPPAPEIVECRKRGVVLNLTVGEDDGGAPISMITVQRRDGPDGKWRWDRRAYANPINPEVVIDENIIAYHHYEFRAKSQNRFGLSREFSPVAVCRTPPEVPGANPADLVDAGKVEEENEVVAPDELRVKWTPVPAELRNGPGFKYVVKYRRQTIETEGVKWETEELVDQPEVDGWSVKGLPDPNSPYDVMVVAFNSEGQSEAELAMTTAWTGEGKPDVAPEGFLCGVIASETTPTTTLCEWLKYREEDVNGEPVGFRLYHWVAGKKEETERHIDFAFDAVSGRVAELTPFAVNEMALKVRNAAFESEASRVFQVKTPEGTPGPVGVLEATPIGEDRMKVSWLPPSQPNGNVVSYKLTLVEVDEEDNEDNEAELKTPAQEMVVDSTNLQLEGLKSRQKYRVLVTASTGAGEGEENFVEKTSTVLIMPDAPKLILLGHDESSVNLTLTPADSDNPGADFFVEYKTSYDAEWTQTDSFQTDAAHFVSLTDLPAGTSFSIRGVSSNGGEFETHSADGELRVTTSGDGPDTREALIPLWLIIVIVVVALLLLLLVILCCIRRSRGGKYAVQQKEREAGVTPGVGIGRNEDREALTGGGLQDGDFHLLQEEENELLEGGKFGGSQISLASSTAMRKQKEDALGGDEDSLIVYNLDPGVDVLKFNEDGSFIGQYGQNRNSVVGRGGMI